MKVAIRRRALGLGFDECRFTMAAPPATAGSFEAWLRAGRHGQMDYLARNARKRVDPQQVLPGGRTIITLAASYHRTTGAPPDRVPSSASPSSRAPNSELRGSSTTGFIARYARSTDYHHVLGERLKLLVGFINPLGGPDTRSLWYVDTGPVLERDLAQRAGLGFVGKHTNLISRRLGNWFFLAEILTTLALDPDAPEKNRCGSCTRCLTACPTRAITGPFQLDARLCISYLTIELKGPIPLELRPAIGRRIFGCDDCLEVCPWNRFAREGSLLRSEERPDLDQPALIDLLALDEPGFRRAFGGTPLLRLKRRGLLRNVCVALGNGGDNAALPALERAAHDPEPLIAEHARWAVDRIRARQMNSLMRFSRNS
jgi:epoxyqueuosine reductase